METVSFRSAFEKWRPALRALFPAYEHTSIVSTTVFGGLPAGFNDAG